MGKQRKPLSFTIQGGGRVLSGLGKRTLAARLLKRPDGKNGNKVIDGKLIQQGVGQWRVDISGLGGRPATISAAR